MARILDSKGLIDAAEAIAGVLGSLLDRAKANDSGEARVAMCLCLTVGEQYLGVIALLRSPAQSHAPVLVRPMLEALCDLRNLVGKSSYLDQLRFDNADQMIKTFNGFLDDPDMKDDAQMQKTMGQWLQKERAIFGQLKEKGFRPVSVSEKFKQIGMSSEYATAYRFMCSFSHSDLNTLIARHGGRGHLKFTFPLPLATLRSVLGLATSIYVQTMNTLSHYSDCSKDDVKTAIETADALWNAASEPEQSLPT